MREAAAENALSPTVESRVGGAISADVDDDLSLCLELMSATRRSSSEIFQSGTSPEIWFGEYKTSVNVVDYRKLTVSAMSWSLSGRR